MYFSQRGFGRAFMSSHLHMAPGKEAFLRSQFNSSRLYLKAECVA